MMEENEYIKMRLDDQISWYSAKSAINKKLHIRVTVTSIVCSAIIPLLSGFNLGHPTLKNITLGLLGATIAVLTGLANLLKYQDKWTEYRIAKEALVQEKMMYGTGTGPYENQADPFKMLVARTEAVLNKENNNWKQYITKKTG